MPPERRDDQLHLIDNFVDGSRAVDQNRLSESMRNLGAIAGVGASAPGAFEVGWGTTLATAAQMTDNPIIVAGAGVAYTLGVEMGGVYGASRLLSTGRGERALRLLSRGLDGLGIKRAAETSRATDTAVAFVAGAGVMTLLKQEADPERGVDTIREYGRKIAVTVTALAAPINLAVAEGITNMHSIEKVGMGVTALAGMVAVGKQIKRHLSRQAVQSSETQIDKLVEAPDYDLDDETCDTLEGNLVEMARAKYGRTVVAVWIDGSRPEANLIRTKEAQAFPQINVRELFGNYDDSSMFLAMIDTRRAAGEGRLIRGTRITGRQFSDKGAERSTQDVLRDGGSDMAMIRDMVVDGELTGEEVSDYYSRAGIELGSCISVETNFKIGNRAPRRLGVVPMSQLAYLSMYKYVLEGDTTNQGAIFAHINKASKDSLERLGITIDLVAGRSDLRTPAGPSSPTRYDDKFKPVAMLNTTKTRNALKRKLLLAPREMYLN
jgi:hypothetical protein